MIGMVLAAGAARRLRPDTDALPKALLPVARRDHDPGHRAAQPGCRRAARGRGRGRARGRGSPRPGPGPAAPPRGDAAARAQRAGAGLEQRLLAVARPGVLRPAARCWSTATPCIRSASRRRCSPRARPPAATAGPELILAIDDVKQLADEEMKVVLDSRAAAGQDQQAAGPGAGLRRVHRGDADRGRPPPRRWPARWRPPGGAIPACTTRTATRSSPTAAARSRSPRSARWNGSRSIITTTCGGPREIAVRC